MGGGWGGYSSANACLILRRNSDSCDVSLKLDFIISIRLRIERISLLDRLLLDSLECFGRIIMDERKTLSIGDGSRFSGDDIYMFDSHGEPVGILGGLSAEERQHLVECWNSSAPKN